MHAEYVPIDEWNNSTTAAIRKRLPPGCDPLCFIRVKGADKIDGIILLWDEKITAIPMFDVGVPPQIIPDNMWDEMQLRERDYWVYALQDRNKLKQFYEKVLNLWGITERNFPTETIVDIGSGPAGLLTVINANRRIAVDPLPLSTVEPGIERLDHCGEKIGLLNNTADRVFICNVIQHVKSPPAVLNEAFRILKPDGKLYICEQLDTKPDFCHPHTLTESLFDVLNSGSFFRKLTFHTDILDGDMVPPIIVVRVVK